MIKLSNLKIPAKNGEKALVTFIEKKTGAKGIKSLEILKKSVDARKKTDVNLIYSVAFAADNEKEILKKCKEAAVYAPKEGYKFPYDDVNNEETVVIVGMGPAGLFAALTLCEAGVKCILVEQGKAVEERTEDVERFWRDAILDISSNVQFGEGGAGTFSDGKLTTGINDPRIPFVFDTFIKFGATKDIKYLAKPHIGTDILKTVVSNMRKYIISIGCDVRFSTKLTDIEIADGGITGCTIRDNNGEYKIKTNHLVLCPGNSARETFRMLKKRGVTTSCKNFAVGVRIEHLQKDIDMAQYGESSRYGTLPHSDYKLAAHLENGRTVYTFCVCPGGYVVAAASEEGGVVTNGMSEYARDNVNINGALLVTVSPEDFGNDTEKAMAFQREIEEKAYLGGGENYCAPAQLVGDFLNKKPSFGAKSVSPAYKPGIKWGNLWEILPKFICESLAEALHEMGKKIKGFDNPYAVLTAVESRSSSPVKIDRENGVSVNVKGLYPAGEGAGYAGGIMSAAVDGIRCAEVVCKNLEI